MSSIEHYRKDEVIEEIFKFAKDRWLAIYAEGRFRRYLKGNPISCRDKLELKNLIELLKPRSIYASSAIFQKLESVEDLDNYVAFTPTLDIDNEIKYFKITIQLIEEILYFIDKYNVNRSIIIKWSGNGCHIHLNHRAISKEILNKYNPLDISYAIIEFIIRKLENKLHELRSISKELKLENLMDTKRVFTCPLSLHREKDLVCVCIEPNSLKDFESDWLSPEGYVHYKNWDTYLEGELDELVLKAFSEIGPKPVRRYKRKYPRVDEQIMKFFKEHSGEEL